MEITLAVPTEYGLLSERFINEYTDFPLIDIEVEASRRMELVEYLRDKYGAENVAHIRTISHNPKDLREIRSVGIHACSIVIAPSAIENFVPTIVVKDRETGESVRVTQYNANDLQSVGLMRINILGNKRLTALREHAKLHNEELGYIYLNNATTFRLFADDSTEVCVRHMSDSTSKGVKYVIFGKF